MRSHIIQFIKREIHAGFSAAKRSPWKSWHLAAVGFGVGATVGGVVALNNIRKSNPAITIPNDEPSFILKEMPALQPSRSNKFPADVTGLKLTLFQYQTCPFCCKVRAMLDCFGISYDVVEVNPVLRTQLKWSQTYKKVPILVVQTPEGEIIQLNDSSMIVSALYSFISAYQNDVSTSTDKNSLHNIVKCYPTVKYNDEEGKSQTEILNKYFLMFNSEMGGRQKEDIMEEQKWRKWADSTYVHTLSPNIYRTFSEAVDSFRYFDKVGEWEKNFAAWERTLVIYVGALAMWVIGRRLQKRHHLKKDVRQSLYEESDFWIKSIEAKGGEFMGGKYPNLADLAVYGVLNSIEGCQAFKDLSSNSKIVSDWYRKVQKHLRSNLQSFAEMG